MTYTGHKDARMPTGETLVEWITPTVKDECRNYAIEMPSPKQMAVVISAMRMHAIMMHAAKYDTSAPGNPDEVNEYWPVEISIGRYFRDAAQMSLEPGHAASAVLSGEEEMGRDGDE